VQELLDADGLFPETIAVMYLDLDRFKVINDSLGQTIGDFLLGAFADRLSGLVEDADLVGRFSADEFVVVISAPEAVHEIQAAANRIEVALSEPFETRSGPIYLSVSIGVAIAGEDDRSAEILLQQASAAMVEAKRRGRDRIEIYDHRMRAQAQARLDLEQDLRLALERQEFEVRYQPKFDLTTGMIVGAEALLRWQHPERGLVMPSDFIPAAEETGLIVRVGRFVLEEAIQQARAWSREYPDLDDFVIAVNFSARQLSAVDLINNLGRVLLKFGWSPDRLAVELTESILIDDAEGSLEVLKQLKSLGVKLSLDDFGTGYSSLSYLHRFPVDIVKIDRAFVRGLHADGSGSPVAAAIMHMAKTLDIVTAAEGVETDMQRRGLVALGCTWAQGFLLAHPLPPDEFAKLLAERPA
jgi:diguanylate cyclase (GGDEF)-like protein